MMPRLSVKWCKDFPTRGFLRLSLPSPPGHKTLQSSPTRANRPKHKIHFIEQSGQDDVALTNISTLSVNTAILVETRSHSPGPGPISNLSTDFRVPSRKSWVAQSSQKIPFILSRPISSQHERRCARRSWYTIDAVMRTSRVPRPVSRNRNRLKIRTTRG